MADEVGKITMDDDVEEAEAEASSDVPSGTPPARIATGSRESSSGDGGGRRSASTAAAPGFIGRTLQFLHDTRAEMRRVSWPGLTLVQNSTIITLVAVIFFALYLFGVDRVWAFLIEHLKTWLGGV